MVRMRYIRYVDICLFISAYLSRSFRHSIHAGITSNIIKYECLKNAISSSSCFPEEEWKLQRIQQVNNMSVSYCKQTTAGVRSMIDWRNLSNVFLSKQQSNYDMFDSAEKISSLMLKVFCVTRVVP